MKRYFTVNYGWFDDLCIDAAILYGYIRNSLATNRIVKVDRETGELYYRVSNTFLMSELQLSPPKIRSLLDELEECGYIDLMIINRPNNKVRYLKCNDLEEGVRFDIFYDFLEKGNEIATLLSLIIKRINVNKETVFNEDFIFEIIGGGLSDNQINRLVLFLERNELITNDNGRYMYTTKMLNFASQYLFPWQKKDC